jgi:predicted PurR-regulated permease PerM
MTFKRPCAFSVSLLTLFIGMLACSATINRLSASSATDNQTKVASNFTDQTVLQKNLTTNQFDDIKEIRKLTSQEVQLLKVMGQKFSRTATQSQFAALGIFLMGIALLIYGLRLTLRATDKQTSRYFKAMIWALITPVIALIAIYQIGFLVGNQILRNVDEPFFIVSLLLLVPAIIILFLMLGERRLMHGSHQKDLH